MLVCECVFQCMRACENLPASHHPQDDTIRGLLDQVRAKMAIGDDEVLKIAIEGPVPFQPGAEETVGG